MVGSKDIDHVMDGGDADDVVGNVEETQSSGGGVSCSICLELVSYNGDRSRAKLQCGHEFHLDCIGSAFNMKGAMQCPNCRKVEKGCWLYSNDSNRPVPAYNIDDWATEWNPDEEPYDIAFPELPMRVHWCPYAGITRVHSPFEELESASATYHDLHGHQAIFAEHSAGSSVAHSYVAYLGRVPTASMNSNDSVDDPTFNPNWNGLSGQNDMLSLHDFPHLDVHHIRGHRIAPNSSHINGADSGSNPPVTLRSNRGEADSITRSGTFAHPFIVGHGSGPRAGSSFVPSMVPHHPGSNIRSHERIQLPHVIHHSQQPSPSPGMHSLIIPGVRRYNGPRGLPPVMPAPSHSDSSGFFVFPPPSSTSRNLHEAENHLPVHHTHVWERDFVSRFPTSYDRDSTWGSHNQASGGGLDSGNRPGNFWQRHRS